MRLLPFALAALVFSSHGHAGEIVWRSPTSGTSQFVPPPPELAVDPAPVVVDFGISYGSARVRSGTAVSISPIWPSRGSKAGYLFSSADLPNELSLDLFSGVIRGRILAIGIYDFSVAISNDTGQSQTVPVVIIVE